MVSHPFSIRSWEVVEASTTLQGISSWFSQSCLQTFWNIWKSERFFTGWGPSERALLHSALSSFGSKRDFTYLSFSSFTVFFTLQLRYQKPPFKLVLMICDSRFRLNVSFFLRPSAISYQSCCDLASTVLK